MGDHFPLLHFKALHALHQGISSRAPFPFLIFIEDNGLRSRTIFLRRGWGESLSIKEPDGRVVTAFTRASILDSASRMKEWRSRSLTLEY